MNDAEFSNKKYAPFINKEIFQNYKTLENLINDIFTMFKFRCMMMDVNSTIKDKAIHIKKVNNI